MLGPREEVYDAFSGYHERDRYGKCPQCGGDPDYPMLTSYFRRKLCVRVTSIRSLYT